MAPAGGQASSYAAAAATAGANIVIGSPRWAGRPGRYRARPHRGPRSAAGDDLQPEGVGRQEEVKGACTQLLAALRTLRKSSSPFAPQPDSPLGTDGRNHL